MSIHYDIFKNDKTDLWFFIVLDDNEHEIYQSEAAFYSEVEAEKNVMRWITDNLLEINKDD